jgi:hypothetical protein
VRSSSAEKAEDRKRGLSSTSTCAVLELLVEASTTTGTGISTDVAKMKCHVKCSTALSRTVPVLPVLVLVIAGTGTSVSTSTSYCTGSTELAVLCCCGYC